MPVFLERFVIPLCATALLALVILNPMRLDITQRAILVGIILLIAAFAAYTVHTQNARMHAPDRQSLSDSEPGKTNLPIEVIGNSFSKTIVLPEGAYQDFVWGGSKFRIDVKRVSRDKIPDRYAYPVRDSDQATIHIDAGGGLVYGGVETTFVAVNEYRVPPRTSNEEEPRSVFFFHSSERHFRFFRVFVDHINPMTKEVSLDIYFADSNN